MSYSIGGAAISDMSFTYSWGMSPASGNLTCLGQLAVFVGGDAVLSIGGSSFFGILSNIVDEIRDGESLRLSFVDNRVKLQNDDVYCLFNRVEVRSDNPATPGIDRQKRYVHILPANWPKQIKTYTAMPYSAAEIIALLLSAPTVATAWSTVLDPLQNKPVPEFDALTGKKLANALQEISDAQGLLFTLRDQATLYFAQKGAGNTPSYTANDTAEHSTGEAISGADTKITVVGDRNRYQDLSIDLIPDWYAGYEAFWAEPEWMAEVARVFGGNLNTFASAATVAAIARKVTVREYAARKGGAWRDFGMWAEVSRMEIPVWIYLQDIVFKAYRVPRNYSFNGVPLDSLELIEGLLCALNYTLDGTLSYKTDELYPDAKGYMLVQGQPLSLLDPKKQRVISEAELSRAGSEWSPCNRFNLDIRNKLVIFEDAIFVSNNLFLFLNNGTDAPESLKVIAVPNANASIGHAAARASLVWDVERYFKVFGSGAKKAPHFVSGLAKNMLFSGGSSQTEIAYADNELADVKAEKIATPLIGRQSTYASGGFKRAGASGTVLTPSIDRVTLTLNFSEGISESVEFSKERSQSNFENERDLERKQRARDLYPGQRSNRTDVERLVAISKVGKELKRFPGDAGYSNLNEVLEQPVGASDCSVNKIFSTQVWSAGQPMFLDDTDKPDFSGNRFAGVVITHNATGMVPVATQGVVPTLTAGPFKKGEVVSFDGYAARPRMDNEKAMGVIESPDYTGNSTVLAMVRLTRWERVVIPPFHIQDVSVKGAPKVRIYYGTVNNRAPVGMSDGDEPPYVIGVSNGQKIWVGLTWDTNTSAITSLWIATGTNVPQDTKTKNGTYYKVLGTVDVDTSGAIPVVYCGDGVDGSLHIDVCREWFSNPAVYSASWGKIGL